MDMAFAIMSYRTFWNRFKKRYIEAFGNDSKYLHRLSNRYCRLAYSKREMINICEGWGDRYRAINLLSCFEDQRTIEVRILPYAYGAEELINSIIKLNEIVLELLNEPRINDKLGYCFSDEVLYTEMEVRKCALQQLYTAQPEEETME